MQEIEESNKNNYSVCRTIENRYYIDIKPVTIELLKTSCKLSNTKGG